MQPSNAVLESTWSDQVANDPKHRPQTWDRPSTTVRREWCRRPQEAHIAEGDKYRRLSVEEIAIIQGFDPSWVDVEGVKENDRIALLGNAVAPPVAQAIATVLREQQDLFKSESLLEICAGIGGLSAAFDFLEPIAKVELWDVACKVLSTAKPWPSRCVVEGRAQDFPYEKFVRKVGLLCGGPPCQPWSQAGLRKGAEDPRDVMGFTPVAIARCEPDVFLFENVPGILYAKEHEQYFKELVAKLREPKGGLRYGVALGILNAADFGVPQVRRRVFILGVKGSSQTFAATLLRKIQASTTHHDPSKAAFDKKPWVTLREALGERQSTESWRKWNVVASVGEEQIVEEASVDVAEEISGQEPSRDEQRPDERTGELSYDRLQLVWPGKNDKLNFNGARWEHRKANGLLVRKALVHAGTEHPEGAGQSSFAAAGDPVSSLNALAPLVRGSAKLIYFDSPRRDQFESESKPGFVDSTWLSLIQEVANAGRHCLAHNGFFTLHTDEASAHLGRNVLDEVFGRTSHITTFAWQKKYGPQSDRLGPTDAFDYIHVYSKCHKDNIEKIGLLEKPEDIIDDGDWRGCYTAGHKGAKSGSESTKFKINVPPYRWKILESSLPKGRHWFDETTGVLWFEKLEEDGEFFLLVEVTDSEGHTAKGKVSFSVMKKGVEHYGDYTLPTRIWWLLESDNDVTAGRKLFVSPAAKSGSVRMPFSLVLEARGGAPFRGRNSAPGAGRYWEFSAQTLVRLIAEARASFGAKGTALPSQKTFFNREDARRIKSVLNWLPWQDYGKTEDANRHVGKLATKGDAAGRVAGRAKPEPLLYHLLQLLAPAVGNIVIGVGDSTASMASVAIKSGRRAIHIIGASSVDQVAWLEVGLPRLKAVLAKTDTDGISDPNVLPDFIQEEPGPLHFLNMSTKEIQFDRTATIVRVMNVEGEDSLRDFYASCIGCISPAEQVATGWYCGLFGQWAYVLASEETLDQVLLSRIAAERPEAERVYVVAECIDIEDGETASRSVQVVHAPFGLVGKV